MQSSSSPMQLTCLHDFTHVKSGTSSALSMAHIQAPCRDETEKRASISISAVIDVSGSMSGEKIELVRQCLQFVVGELTAGDSLGIVAFDDNVEERLPMTAMDGLGKIRAATAVEQLHHRGSTNLSGGLFAGMDQVQGKPFQSSTPSTSVPSSTNNVRPMKKMMNKMSSVIASVSSSISCLTATTPSTPHHVDPGAPSSIQIKAAHLYTSVKRNQDTLHKYTITVTVPKDALSSVASVFIVPSRGAPITPTLEAEMHVEVLGDAVVPECKVIVSFRSGLKLDNVELDWTLGTTIEGSVAKEVTTAPTKPATPPPVPAEAKGKKSLSYVWLFTDGQANVGITDPGTLIAETRKRLEGSGITGIYTFGFGASHNSNLLQSIAESSLGSYFFIRATELIKDVFANCLGGLLSIVAHNIVLLFAPGPSTKVGKVLSTLPYETSSASVITIKMKDLYSEEQRDLLVELVVSATTLGSTTLGTWTLHWQDTNNESHSIAIPSAVQIVDALPEGLTCNTAVDEQRNRIMTTLALEEARKVADSGDVVRAKAVVQSAIANVKASTSAACGGSEALANDLERAMDNMVDQRRWNSEGSKVVGQMSNMHAMQRSNALECCDAYETKGKKAMKSKMSLF